MDIKLSNTKGLLIIFVVFGHLLELNKIPFINLFVFRYTFHMPLFVFLSGYFSKNAYFKKVVRTGITLFLFQVLFSLFFKYFGFLEISKLSAMTVPVFHLWYLASMIYWYLVVILLNKVKAVNKFYFALLFVFLIIGGIMSRCYTFEIAGMIPIEHASGYTFGFQRTLSFLPFFLLGFILKEKQMTVLYDLKPKSLKVLLVPLLFIGYSLSTIDGIERLYRGSFGFTSIMTPIHFSRSYLLIIAYVMVTIISLTVLNFVPVKKCFLTKIGKNSLTIFLFHPVVVVLAFSFKETILLSLGPYFQFLLWGILTSITCLIFGSDKFVSIIKKTKLI